MQAQKGITVLIAEDDFIISTAIQKELQDLGYTVIGRAPNGQVAVEMTQSLHPDVVLMDIGMPNMNGLQATQHIYQTCPTPVVILTAYDAPNLVEQAGEVGAGAYLVKMPNAREIERAITIAIARFDDMMALRESNRRLEKALVKLRDTQKQLVHQERLAAVGQLSAGIAHDFRTLLTTIILYAQMSSRQPDLSPKLARNIGIIANESKKAADLIQQILDFSSRSVLRVQTVDLRILVQNTMNTLLRTAPGNVQFSLEVGAGQQPAAFMVQVDPGRIQQVLSNLAVNACDAMPKGGELRFELSHVTISADETPPLADMPPPSSPQTGAGMPPLSSHQTGGTEGKKWVCIVVSDTGTGMTDEVRAHMFEPFFTTKDVDKGTGLGLAQVYGIIRKHEGYIDAETKLGQGTTFRIYLPAYEADSDRASVDSDRASVDSDRASVDSDRASVDSDRASMKEAQVEQAFAHLQGQGETILLVEDNDDLRKAGYHILESLGYRVLAATNGREALAIYETSDGVDLVITDVMMPKMGGKELMQELQRLDPNIKVLAITGYTGKKVTEELKEAGFLDVISKPFEVETLARVTHRALNARVGRWR